MRSERVFATTIDAIATDHAPHGPTDKDVELIAANGVVGLETAFALGLRLCAEGVEAAPPD